MKKQTEKAPKEKRSRVFKEQRTKIAKAQQAKMPGEWLYLTAEGINVRQIADAVGDAYETELWEEAGVLEIMLGEKSSMDIEQTRVRPGDTFTADFLLENGCAEIFLVTFVPETYERAEALMRQILSRCGGLFCGDTEDFTPVIRE